MKPEPKVEETSPEATTGATIGAGTVCVVVMAFWTAELICGCKEDMIREMRDCWEAACSAASLAASSAALCSAAYLAASAVALCSAANLAASTAALCSAASLADSALALCSA